MVPPTWSEIRSGEIQASNLQGHARVTQQWGSPPVFQWTVHEHATGDVTRGTAASLAAAKDAAAAALAALPRAPDRLAQSQADHDRAVRVLAGALALIRGSGSPVGVEWATLVDALDTIDTHGAIPDDVWARLDPQAELVAEQRPCPFCGSRDLTPSPTGLRVQCRRCGGSRPLV